ncbi:MAG: protein TolQ [Myxococcota bacterium]|jgi:biopolymer transport protein TolQ|nr:protein TolQ [Myxococcota bacterium]
MLTAASLLGVAQAETSAEMGQQLDMFELVLDSSGVVLGVLIVLVAMSLVSWYIIGFKLFYLRKARKESDHFLDTFWASKRLDAIYKQAESLKRSPVSQVFKAGYIELSKLKSQSAEGGEVSAQLTGIENVERALRRASVAETTQLESLVPFLATTGSTAPFIGLFGTVWGIMNAFVSLSSATAALGVQAVAGPIAEALIATAIGLLAAIPSVMAYNYFSQRIKVLSAEMDSFSADFLNIVKRHFFK